MILLTWFGLEKQEESMMQAADLSVPPRTVVIVKVIVVIVVAVVMVVVRIVVVVMVVAIRTIRMVARDEKMAISEGMNRWPPRKSGKMLIGYRFCDCFLLRCKQLQLCHHRNCWWCHDASLRLKAFKSNDRRCSARYSHFE